VRISRGVVRLGIGRLGIGSLGELGSLGVVTVGSLGELGSRGVVSLGVVETPHHGNSELLGDAAGTGGDKIFCFGFSLGVTATVLSLGVTATVFPAKQPGDATEPGEVIEGHSVVVIEASVHIVGNRGLGFLRTGKLPFCASSIIALVVIGLPFRHKIGFRCPPKGSRRIGFRCPPKGSYTETESVLPAAAANFKR